MALTNEERALLQNVKDDQTEIKTVLLGVPNTDDTGLVGEVKELARGHGRLKKNFWILVGLLIGAGVISGSVITAVNGG